jgi:hypothetical protein
MATLKGNYDQDDHRTREEFEVVNEAQCDFHIPSQAEREAKNQAILDGATLEPIEYDGNLCPDNFYEDLTKKIFDEI